MRLQAMHRNLGSGTVTAPNSVAMRWLRQSFRWHFPLQQHGHYSLWLSACAAMTARQKLLRFGQGQSQVGNIAKTFRPADLYQIGAHAAGITLPSQSTATPIASPFPRSAIDPTDRTPCVVIHPFAGHSRPPAPHTAYRFFENLRSITAYDQSNPSSRHRATQRRTTAQKKPTPNLESLSTREVAAGKASLRVKQAIGLVRRERTSGVRSDVLLEAADGGAGQWPEDAVYGPFVIVRAMQRFLNLPAISR
jgi:hypothetical protein